MYWAAAHVSARCLDKRVCTDLIVRQSEGRCGRRVGALCVTAGHEGEGRGTRQQVRLSLGEYAYHRVAAVCMYVRMPISLAIYGEYQPSTDLVGTHALCMDCERRDAGRRGEQTPDASAWGRANEHGVRRRQRKGTQRSGRGRNTRESGRRRLDGWTGEARVSSKRPSS